MAHQLDFISKDHVLKALNNIEDEFIPKNNRWSEYWINYNSKLFPFKYVVSVASSFSNKPLQTKDFTSNDSSRNYIAKLGFHILFKSIQGEKPSISYWVGASNYGPLINQTDMIDDFLKKKYWGTDHDLKEDEGRKIFKDLENIKIDDRICIRYYDRKGGMVSIAAIGTVNDKSEIKNGKLGVIWDYNPPFYKGKKPSGNGAGNWWRTIFKLKREEDIELIFNAFEFEKRVARIAWNDNGWILPSGPYGKSKNSDSHEFQFGYGHEEWLFDSSKIIDEYHYGFLEPVRKQYEAYIGKKFYVWLFSIHSETKKRYWVGEINNLEVINRSEAESIKKIYIKNGWFREMQEQIKASGASQEGFSDWKGVDLFNVKFRIKDSFINDPYFELNKKHIAYSQSRYTFSKFKKEFEFNVESINNELFEFISPDINESQENEDVDVKKGHHNRQPKSVEIIYLHEAISKSLAKKLRLVYGAKNVKREHSAGYGGNRVDLVVKDKDELIFYEIKTYNSIKTSVREAMGQLLEYCYYPNHTKAKELIIVTQIPITSEIKQYFKHLRSTFSILIYYQSYDIKMEILSEKY